MTSYGLSEVVMHSSVIAHRLYAYYEVTQQAPCMQPSFTKIKYVWNNLYGLAVNVIIYHIKHTFALYLPLTEDRNYRQVTAVPTSIVSHDGTDVPIYAAGPMAHLFHSTHEQHYIFYVMTYAACLDGRKRGHCAGALKETDHSTPVTCGQTSAKNAAHTWRNAIVLIFISNSFSVFLLSNVNLGLV